MVSLTEIHGRIRTTRELEWVLNRSEFFENEYLKPIIREWHKRQRQKL